MEVRALHSEEREACLDLWCAVWGDNRPYFRRYLYGDVEWLPYYTQVAVVENRIVSAVHICKRTVACGDFRLTMGGIANVATLPEYRGQGYNTACLQRAFAVMEADVMDFSLLFTGINGYYERQGYATLPRQRVRGIVREGFAPRPTSYRTRPATDADIPAIRALYADYNRRRPIAVQRSEAYWRDWIGFAPDTQPEPPLLAIDREGHPVGYVCFHMNFYPGHQSNEDYAYITELGTVRNRAEEADVITALLEAVTVRSLASGKRELHLSIAVESAVLSALEAILEIPERNTTPSGMVRLLHRENLLRNFAMEWTDRWIAGGRPSGTVTFATPYGPTRLNADGAFLRVELGEEQEEMLPQSALFGLLFGSLSPQQATADPSLHPLLACLFPPQAAVYWSADGF